MFAENFILENLPLSSLLYEKCFCKKDFMNEMICCTLKSVQPFWLHARQHVKKARKVFVCENIFALSRDFSPIS